MGIVSRAGRAHAGKSAGRTGDEDSDIREDQYDCWREELVPPLAEESVRVLGLPELGPAAREHIENFTYSRSSRCSRQ